MRHAYLGVAENHHHVAEGYIITCAGAASNYECRAGHHFPCGRSGGFDLDLFLGFHGFRLFGKRYREHALADARFDLVRVDFIGQGEAALKRARIA